MHYYKATIQYDGTGYAGFQWQAEAKTIQSELNEALAQLITGKFSTLGASRTDAGVHASEQVVKVTCEAVIDCTDFPQRLNAVLPSQIRCLQFVPCEGSFNPSIDALTKEYHYRFTNLSGPDFQPQRFVANIANPLDMVKMQACVALIVGKHDFHNFYSAGSNVKSTVREVLLCELTQTDCYQLRIIAPGFLKQMIRHLVGALWMAGSSRLSVEEFQQLLDGPKSSKLPWKPATARGLCLHHITYQ